MSATSGRTAEALGLSPHFTVVAMVTMLLICGCGSPAPSIDLPKVVSGTAVKLSFSEDKSEVEHLEMELQSALQNTGKVVVIDFWAEWCGPCKMLSPELNEVARQLNESHVVVKVNVDDNPEFAQQLQVSSIPDVRVFKDGKSIGGFVGYREADAILAALR